jgi:hypothetical protein
MELNNWDPLDTKVSSELVIATMKRQIKNILKSYTGWFDPLSELIQNALDAVDHRSKKDKNFIPSLWVKVDLKDNTISVTDNGIGFSEDQFKSFLAPNVSFKKQDDRGNKGVGATYLGYGFNYLQIGTKTPDFYFVGTMKDGREWVEDITGTKTRPKVQKSEVIHDVFEEIDQGSTFSLKLVGEYIRPRDLKWVGASNVNQWGVVLKIKTPLGGIYPKREYLLSKCHLEVVDENGEKTEKEITDCQYIYPHNVIPTSKELKTIRKVQQGLISKGKDGSRLPSAYQRLNGLYDYWTYQDFISTDCEFQGVLDDQEIKIAENHKLFIYGFFFWLFN